MANNLADLFEHAVDAYGHDRIAIVEGDRRLDYADFDALANRWASALSDLGVEAGSHVGVHLRNGVDCMALMVGILKLRAVPVSINYRYVGPELEYLYEYSDIIAVPGSTHLRKDSRVVHRSAWTSWTERGVVASG